MAKKIVLTKGQAINLTKETEGSKLYRVEAGWDTSEAGNTDCDIQALLVGSKPEHLDICYYNEKSKPGVTLDGDNRTGEGDFPDETIKFDFTKVSTDIKRIPVSVSIYKGAPNFGLVKNLMISIVDETTNQEVASFMPEIEASTSKAMVLGEFVIVNGTVNFKASGIGYADNETLLKDYGFEV